MPPLKVFNLGSLGVNVRDSPLHIEDGELRHAQNAELSKDEAEIAIVKRLGIELWVSDELAGPPLQMTPVPLPDPFPTVNQSGTRLYVNTSTDGSNQSQQTSTNGTSWSLTGDPPVRSAVLGGGVVHDAYQRGGHISRNGSMFYLDTSVGFLRRWNGTTETTVTSNELQDLTLGSAMNLFEYDDDIWVVMQFGNNLRLVQFTGSAWELMLSQSGWRGYVACEAWSRIYVPNDVQEMAYWSAEDGFVDQGVFTGEATPGTMYPTDIAVGPGGLYVTLDRNGQDPGLVFKLTDPDSTWEDITPASNTTGIYGPMAMLGSELFVGRSTSTLAPTFSGCEVWKYDGSSFTLDEDLTGIAANSQTIRSLVAFNGELYAMVARSVDPSLLVMRRASDGTWTTVISQAGIDQSAPTGPIGFF